MGSNPTTRTGGEDKGCTIMFSTGIKEMYCPLCGEVLSIEGAVQDRWRTIQHYGHYIEVKRQEAGTKLFVVVDTRAAVLID